MNENIFNVMDFGARGDGASSDTDALQRALDAAGECGGAVFFPAGLYRCHGLRARAHTMLRAEPSWGYRKTERAGATLLLDDERADCLLDVTGAFGLHVYGLSLHGIRGAEKPVHGIFLNNAEKWSPQEDMITLDDVNVRGFSGHGVYLRRVWLFIVRHGCFCGNGGDGIRIRGWDGFVTDNQFSANGGDGFGCEDVGSTVMFTANRVEWNRGCGLRLVSGDDWNVTGNSFDRNWCAGLDAAGMRAVSVTGNVFRRCGRDPGGLPAGGASCQVHLEDCSGLAMTGNTFLAGRDDRGEGTVTPEAGFVLKRLSHSVVSGNALCGGYTRVPAVDLGGHDGLVFKDNPGSAV